jgi:putative tryptophan/tyrosine transport system substrate-binding protein
LRRRIVLVAGLAALLIAPQRLAGQQTQSKIPRVGILSLAGQPSAKIFDAFRAGLRDLGYVDGQNITIEYRLAAGDFNRLPAMAGELVQRHVDVIIIEGGAKLAQIAQDATRTIPIVGALGPDPVAAGFAASLARPGGNVTGFSGFGVELSGKRPQLLKEAFPATSRLAVLWSSADRTLNRRATEEAAPPSAWSSGP